MEAGCLSSIARGTDILGCFVGGSPIDPAYRGESQKRHLAMDVQVYDGNANAIICDQCERVCASPHPSMPIEFLKDTDGLRYRAAYIVHCRVDQPLHKSIMISSGLESFEGIAAQEAFDDCTSALHGKHIVGDVD